jgi:GntR family transcriptional repressor for pyruvate dehydrogenase complex
LKKQQIEIDRNRGWLMTNTDASENLKSNNLSELVLKRIQQLILNKEFKPGDLLPSEKEISERFGVGKSSVREAIKMLHVLGVVESKQGIGTRIRETLGSDVMTSLLLNLTLQQSTSQQLLEFREMFEVAYTEMAMEKATEADKQKLLENIEIIEDKFKEGKLSVDDDIEFHKVILEMTRNPFVIKIGHTVFELLRPSMHSQYYSTEKAVSDHKSIVEAFYKGDWEYAKKTILNTLDTSYKRILEIKEN